MSFGQNLLSLRKEKGLSQDELGGQLNVSRQTVSKWELDETTPELAKLIMLSEYFGISIDELVKGPKSEVKVEVGVHSEVHCVENKVTKGKKSTQDIVLLVLKFAGIIIGGLVVIDVVFMIAYFLTKGFPA